MKDFLVSSLNDLYGALLTKKQSEMLKDYYEFDFSLAEIAENHGVSRQAVHFSIKQAEDALKEYESKLKLYEKMKSMTEQIKSLYDYLEGKDDVIAAEKVKELENNLRSYYGTIQQFE